MCYDPDDSKRLLRHAFSFTTPQTNPEALTDYESMREPIARMSSLSLCLTLVIWGREFDDTTKNETPKVMQFLRDLVQNYTVEQDVGYYTAKSEDFIPLSSSLPKSNGAVITEFCSKAIHKEVEGTKLKSTYGSRWYRPGELGYNGMGHSSSLQTVRRYKYQPHIGCPSLDRLSGS